MQRKILGRGLKALIPEADLKDPRNDLKVQKIPIEDIVPNRYQPRKKWDDSKIEDLANSIREKGIVQPIVVQKRDNGFELIAGERRLRAVKKLNLKTILALVKNISDNEMLEISLIENIQRENLNPLDEALAYHQLMKKFNYTQEEVSRAVGKNRSSIANYIRLLKLPDSVKNFISEETISMGHARALIGIESSEKQKEIGNLIISKGLSVRDVESLSSSVKKRKNSEEKVVLHDKFQLNLEEKLQKLLGTKVKIRKGNKGGKIELYFYSDNDFERIYEILYKHS